MDNSFHYDPADYREKVIRIAEHAVLSTVIAPTTAPRADFEINSYHGSAIRKAERDRMGKLYPRLHR